ncbi:MAG: VCBS repeat-containing protein, partial [Flavobacteriales bacterium]|nr:VCBS repeat-containing protein [Flavobacteriales bacterium]
MQPEVFWDYVQKGYNYQYMTNVLQVNNGRGFFSDVSQYAGIASTDWSWAVLGFDADQDGLKDLYITNGINRDIRNNDFALSFQEKLDNNEQVSLFDMVQETPVTQLSNYFFHNQGDFRFDKTQTEMGLDQPSFSFGAAYGDLDNDGDLDLIVNNNNEPPFVYKNEVGNNNWLQVRTNAGGKNPFGYGAKAIIHVNGEMQYQECTPVRGYQSSCEPIMHFGLGSRKTIDSLLIIFPDGSSIKEYDVQGNQMLEYSIAKAKNQPVNVYQFPEKSFQDYTVEMGERVAHKENDFDDFDREILLPHKQSDLGPAMAVADVNGDGMDDVFLGGAHGEAAQLLLQNASRTFTPSKGMVFNKQRVFEDVAAVFNDFDGDGDQDLIVARGGYENSDGKHQLFLNEGGVFTEDHGQWPEITSNAGAIALWDWDADGDQDVVIGGHAKPGLYPKNDPTYFLQNNNGSFELMEVDPAMTDLGIVAEMAVGDVVKGGAEECVVVGERMSPTVLQFQDGQFSVAELPGLSNHVGWWHSIALTDVDKDGQLDLVCGNIGDNNKFHVDEEHPLKVYGHDFDGNGTNDVVLSKKYKGNFVPVRGRECSSEQMPFVKEKFKDYESFSEAEIQEVLGEEMNDATYY